jgi:hypothetical protein
LSARELSATFYQLHHCNKDQTMKPLTRAAIAFVALWAAIACSDGPVDPIITPPPPPSLKIESVENLVPGQTAVLSGKAMNTIESFTVDGEPVQITNSTPDHATFTVPVMRTCETDGRSITLTAAGGNKSSSISAPVAILHPIDLRVGEQLYLDQVDDISCIQIPAKQDFALTAVNLEPLPQYTHANPVGFTPMATLRTFTPGTAAPTGELLPAVQRDPTGPGTPEEWQTDSETTDPEPYDPTYATAEVGDTVRFVNWTAPEGMFPDEYCTLPRSELGSYEAVVAAVQEDLVVVVGERHPDAEAYLSDAGVAYLTAAAQIAAPVLLPTMRAVFDREYEPLAGGGGRIYVIVEPAPGGVGTSTDGGTGRLQSGCAASSEMTTLLVGGGGTTFSPIMASTLAATIIHEYAHNADWITASRFQKSGAIHFQSEAWAELSVEVAGRIASGQPTQADEPEVIAAGLTVTHNNLLWGARSDDSPFVTPGNYLLGSNLLAYARDRFGDGATNSTGPLLYQTLMHSSRPIAERWSLSGLAGIVGAASWKDLLIDWALAHSTSGLIDRDAAQVADLPQYLSWDFSGFTMDQRDKRTRNPSRKVSYTQNTQRTLGAAPGNYAAAYFYSTADRGVSFSLSDLADTPFQIRITRLR